MEPFFQVIADTRAKRCGLEWVLEVTTNLDGPLEKEISKIRDETLHAMTLLHGEASAVFIDTGSISRFFVQMES